MKNIVPVLCLVFFGMLSAQQWPLTTQNQFNAFSTHTAFAGIEEAVDFRVGHRRQWMGFEGAPSTTWFSVHGNIGRRKRKPVPYALHISDTSVYSKLFSKARPRIIHGWGFLAFYDKLGAFDRIQAQIAYSLHLPLTRKINLALSPSIGLVNHGIQPDKIELLEPDDPLFNQYIGSNSRFSHLDLGASALLYGERWWFGYSVRQLLGNKVYFGDQPTEARLDMHHVLLAGYVFELNESFEIQVNVSSILAGEMPFLMEAGSRLRYRKLLWGGFAWRSSASVSAIAGIHITPFLSLGYAYDFPYAMARANSVGTHEVFLGIKPFRNSSKQNRYLW